MNLGIYKAFCYGFFADSGENEICVIAIGQFAYGIITIGEFSVGIISISQFGISFLLGINQIGFGFIFNIGQFAVSNYVYKAHFGLALIKVNKAVIGVNCLDAAINNKSFIVLRCKEAVSNE